MKYVGEKRLEELLDTSMVDDMDTKEMLMHIVMYECRELPEPQWQTLEEFEANPAEGLYWIELSCGQIDYARYYFFFHHAFSDRIMNVSLINKPRAPK